MAKQAFVVGQRVYTHWYGITWRPGTIVAIKHRPAGGGYHYGGNYRRGYGKKWEYIKATVEDSRGAVSNPEHAWTTEKLNSRRHILSVEEYEARIAPQIRAKEEAQQQKADALFKRYVAAAGVALTYQTDKGMAAFLQRNFTFRYDSAIEVVRKWLK